MKRSFRKTRQFTVAVGAFLLATGVATQAAWAADVDADTVDDTVDNCPGVFNPLQADCDKDGQGDACNTKGAAGADSDRDGVCDAVDNCASVANVDQRDCNSNGTGDMCEGAQASRDDDADGICNGADSCPLEASNICSMVAITVPWVPANPTIAHPTYSGATHTLKGIARYGGNQFMWDFGDGSSPTAWTAITNAYNLGTNHVYSGSVGQTFIATLSVRNSGNPGVVATATYRVKIEKSGALPTNGQMDPNEMDVRIDMAIDQGLWYLHTNMARGTYADGSPGYAQPYGYWSGVLAGTCTAVDAFFLHGSKPNKDYAADPYVETAQRALNYLLASNTSAAAISNQVHASVTDRPDYNGNGIGILFGPNDTYTNGICGVAIASSGTPTRQSLVGSSIHVRGRVFKDIVQDMSEWFAYGQADSGTYRGGWQYSANSNTADGSTNQWPLLAIAAGEDNMAITTPKFVRTEAPYFMNYSFHATKDNRHGGWGYQGPNDVYVNHAKTAAGMLFHYFEGDSASHPRVQAALGYLYRNWARQNYDGGGAWNVGLGNSYAMYGIMKAMRKPQPNILRVVEYNYNTSTQTTNSFDWYYTPPGQTQEGLATNLVKRQAASGMWSDTIGNNAQSGAFATGWDVLILSKGVTIIPPEAKICDCTATWDQNQDVTLDASCSKHPDLNRAIVKYEWDFNYVNSQFDVDATGVKGTKVGGYPSYNTFPVALRITDDNPLALGGPQTSMATCSVVIKPPPHCPHPAAGGPYVGGVNIPVQLDASATWDPDGDPLTYAWDFDNDGLFGAADQNVFGQGSDGVGINPQFAFPQPGTFAIAVKVTDNPLQNPIPYDKPPCSQIAYSTVEIGNVAPVAVTGGPYTSYPSSTIQLNGGGSYDPNGDNITYGWDLNNDGVFTDSTSATPSFTVGNVAPSTVYPVCLKVSDPFGRTDTRCTTVTVLKLNTPPTCEIVSPNVVRSCTGGEIQVVIDGTRSADADGDQLTYQWVSNCQPGTFSSTTSAMPTLTVDSQNAGCSKGCTATLTVSDGKAQASCNAAITITDNTAPAFANAPQDITIECNGNAQAALNAWLAGATATDSCTSATVGNDFVAVAGGCGGATGSTTVTWTATDACGNTEQATAKVTVADSLAPVVSCPAPTQVECTGVNTTVALSASATDDCNGTVAASGPTSGSYPVGTTSVQFSAADTCGNSASCTSTVTVVDTTRPAATCPANVTAECNATHKATGVSTGTATGSDICGDVTVSSPAPADYALGTSTVTHTITDAAGNAATCTNTVTVADTTKPSITCPASVSVECNATGKATAVDTGVSTASDVCGGVTLSDPAAADYALGSSTVTHTATDEAGNAASCTNTVTVADTTKPSITCPANVTAECNATHKATGVSAGAASGSDVCGSVAVSDPALADYALGTTTVTHTATDDAGLASSCTNTITVADTTKPSITCPANVTVECNATHKATAVNTGTSSASDVCGSVTVSDPAAADYALGTSTVTHTATDEAGLASSCTNTVTVADTTQPSITCPANVAVECNAFHKATAVNTGTSTASDVCGAVTVSDPAAADYALGTSTVTHSATDEAGLATTCTNTVTVADTTKPTIACPANVTVECNAQRKATAVDTGVSTASDVCGTVTISDPAAADYALGTSSVTHSATDEAGLAATCTSTVTVADTTAPAIVCPADVVVECNAAGSATGVSAGAATASDVCTTAAITDPAVATYALGSTTTTHSASDEAGNTATCTNQVTVQDTTPPVFDQASLFVRNVVGNCSGSNVTFTLPVASDVCQNVTVTCATLSGSMIGANTVPCTATDAAGNTATASITVNVLSPLHLAFQNPLADDNQPNDITTDADVTNLFSINQMVRHVVKILACNGADVTSTYANAVTLRLTLSLRANDQDATGTNIVPDYQGVGDEGGVFQYTNNAFGYNLDTNRTDYVRNTNRDAQYYSSIVTMTFNSAPNVIAAQEDVRLESR